MPNRQSLQTQHLRDSAHQRQTEARPLFPSVSFKSTLKHCGHALTSTFSFCSNHRVGVTQSVIALVGFVFSCRIHFGSVYAVCACMIFICLNLGHDSDRPIANRLSAYSVFNRARGFASIGGNLSLSSFERLPGLDGTGRPASATAPLVTTLAADKGHYVRKSAAANQPCVCGSGKKYKRCCSLLTKDKAERKLDDEEL